LRSSLPLPMADFLISAVSTSYTGTEASDDYKNSRGNLRDITVDGGSGSDFLTIASGAKDSDGTDGERLGFSIASSTLLMGVGDDTIDFIGSDATGVSQLANTQANLGLGDDYIQALGIASASASTVRGNEGNDEIRLASHTGFGNTLKDVRLNGNAGADEIQFQWSGTELAGFGVLGGADADTVSATFVSNISAFASADNTFTGAKIGGNKGDDVINANVLGTSDQVRVNGNSGSDTIVVTAAADNVRFAVAGGKDNDVVSAVFVGGNTSEDATVAGSLGNDTVGFTIQSGGRISAALMDGASGDDALTFATNGGVALTASTGNEILGGSGADTITLNVGADIVVTGVSGFVVNLEGDGAGVLDVNLSANITARTGAGAFFVGSTTGDDIDVSNGTGVFGLFNATFSAEAGNDTITFAPESAGTYSATTFGGGSGADLITAQIAANTQLAIATGGRVAFEGGSGSDTIVANIEAGASISAGLFDGGVGADSLTLNLLSGGSASVVQSGTELAGGLGNDTIAIAALQPTTAGAVLRAGGGDDLITGTFASGGIANGITADGGSGADTIAFTFSASTTAGVSMNAASGAVFNAGEGADSITLIAQGAVTAGSGSFNFGDIRGGADNDSITFGGNMGTTAATGAYTGTINGGAGADSIVFSGNNILSGQVGTFVGGGALGSAGFVFASGDSTVSNYDTIFVSNNAVTGGQTNLVGTFGSAGFLFTGFNDTDAGGFNSRVQTAGAFTGGGGFNFSEAIFTSEQIANAPDGVVLTGGVIGGVTAGGAPGSAGGGVVGAFIITGGSNFGQIISAVDGMTIGRGSTTVFNVQNGSGGSVDGYMFTEGGIAGDMVVKFEGHGVAAGAFSAGSDAFFSAGNANGLSDQRGAFNSVSGGQLFFGPNVGVG
jgi:hypothetical protein